MKRWIPRIVALLLVAGAAAALWFTKPWEKGEPDVTFSTVPVGKGPIQAQVTANGTLSARTTVQVGAQVSGRIMELKVDFNDPVKEKQVIAKLDEEPLRQQLDQAQANYDQAIANEKKAAVGVMDGKRQYDRQKSLQDQQLVSASTVEGFEVTWKTAIATELGAKASISQAAANLAQARTNLAYATIYSPIDGIVLSRAVDVGQTVQASFSAPTLFTIAADLSRMQIDTSVAESDVGRLDSGVTATFTVDAFPGKTFKGTVRQVRNAAAVTSGVVTYDAVIDVDNSEHLLRPGMTANVTFVLAQVADVVKIPNAALRFKPTREQMQAIREHFGGKSGGSGHHHGGSGGSGGSADGSDHGGGGSDHAGRGDWNGVKLGADGKPDFGDKKPVWKLQPDGRPKMVLIKPGLTDGSSTQMLEGELQPGDLLITEVRRPAGGEQRQPAEGERVLNMAPLIDRSGSAGPRSDAERRGVLIDIRGVHRTYVMGDNLVHALRGVDLVIERGASIAIMGTSGSGKSTMMNIMGCLDQPTQGSYILDGRDVARLSRAELADVRGRMIGFVFQSFNLLSRTSALENVEMPLMYQGLSSRERRRRAMVALDRVNLADRHDHHPNQLSGGQQQRVAIARALVGEAPIIMADEPTGNLDSKTSYEVMAILQGLVDQGITVVIVTHEPDIAAYARRVVTLRDGLILEDKLQEPVRASPAIASAS